MKTYTVLANSVSLPKHGGTYYTGQTFMEHHADETIIAELLKQNAIEEYKEPVAEETKKPSTKNKNNDAV